MSVGAFTGARTLLNTDGIALTQIALGPFTEGAVYAAYAGGNVAAFDGQVLADTLGLRTCPS